MIFSSDVLNAIKGELGDVITQVPLAVGQIFDANRFTNLIVPNVPVVCIDNNWQVSTIKQCDQGFVLPQEAGKYLFLGPVVSSALGYVYVSKILEASGGTFKFFSHYLAKCLCSKL